VGVAALLLAGLGLLSLGAAGCGGAAGAGRGSGAPASDRFVYVFHQDGKGVSVIDPASDKVVKTEALGATAPYPSNQYATGSGYALLGWKTRVDLVDLNTMQVVKSIPLPAKNVGVWADMTPGGHYGVIAAREAEEILWVDTDPKSPQFGKVVDKLSTPGKGP
jgi:DNA-binding beta-propeller fold protein YncE